MSTEKHGFIDADAHILEPDDIWEKYLDPEFRDQMPRTRCWYEGEQMGFGFEIDVGGYNMPIGVPHMLTVLPGLPGAYAEYARQGFPPRVYKTAMERVGMEYMVAYPTIGLYVTSAPTLKAATAAAYRRAYNRWLHDFCVEAGKRLLGAGSLDLRDPEEAAREATRCVKEYGFKALHINPAPVGGRHLYDPCYDRLWATIAELNVPVGVHVSAYNATDPMLQDYLPGLPSAQAVMAFSIGNMIASAAFIVGGVLERHPKLRVVHLESGAGWAAFWLDRLKAGLMGGFRDVDIPGLSLHPIEYFQRQCYIAADTDDPGIKQVIDVMGDNNIVLSTDFGHPEGWKYTRAVEELMEVPGVSADSKRKIMWDNSLKLHALPPG
jgi:predicted TIM-barrel fold metal-dependent hydrolase